MPFLLARKCGAASCRFCRWRAGEQGIQCDFTISPVPGSPCAANATRFPLAGRVCACKRKPCRRQAACGPKPLLHPARERQSGKCAAHLNHSRSAPGGGISERDNPSSCRSRAGGNLLAFVTRANRMKWANNVVVRTGKTVTRESVISTIF